MTFHTRTFSLTTRFRRPPAERATTKCVASGQKHICRRAAFITMAHAGFAVGRIITNMTIISRHAFS